jgi:L,D-transpeptidase YbiS
MTTPPEMSRRAPVFAAPEPRTGATVRPRRSRTHVLWFFLLFAAVAVLAGPGTGYRYRTVDTKPASTDVEIPPDDAALQKMAARLRQKERQLLATIERKRPKGHYIVIDQTQNRLWLMKDDEVLREAKCSAGSGMYLQEAGGNERKWVFDTPRGQYKVLNKIKDPVWKKPDWAFIEEGLPIPKNPSDRFDYGVLGQYALYFGNGYMIHGTLYENLIGRSVTHGCIRLGREDLSEVYRVANLGTPIYIY